MLRSEAATRTRRHLLHLVALVILGCGSLDFVLSDAFPTAALLVRVAWATSMVGLGRFSVGASSTGRDRILVAAAVVTVASWLPLSILFGGSSGPYFWWMLALPLYFSVLAPDNLPATVMAGGGALLGNLGVMLAEGAPGNHQAVWLLISASSLGLSIVGVLSYRRLLVAESELERSRIQAEKDLAISEQRRIHAEKLALIGKLAAGIAHEINNPLAYVKANLDHLRRENGDALLVSELETVLEESQIGIQRIEQIVTGMRSFAREDEANLQACSLRDVAEEAVRLSSIRTRRVAAVHLDVPAGLPLVRASRTRLLQVLVNLLVNAADALADRRGPNWIRVEGREVDGGVQIAVADSGGGIPDAALPHLFEPFFTTKPDGKGTGLGLNLAKEFVEGFGGTIAAENVPGAGARFVIRLPTAVSSSRAA